ncbi:MAG: EamA family transporter [Candidatus Dactylopiibacterium carminicum]|uniref:EamA family transporter n=1 Tax=Candidatus Dactylopiibacterium carminicum TaxID=857335 RepID=A0A272END1_9RHOO|nr:DMT family transporter [Candidatus Dactylopiibacterium carminicum]KAF7598030.1 EamA/RhaT family transporter [Candidatus Dactylopiibacterium carminicum]PAS91612.1 MAG: EamA family transporter [Candidatus Dactylopiibacterium carminicum]PAS93531.1 MAG: EamA family transporter [Candidatus Dactylopiibacterium carminicum]PAS96378.1 MAG: EamA family transporter [Candidatus Dactylopiibacterium carminicum]
MPQSFRIPRFGVFLLLIVVFGWGLSWAVIKYALEQMPPLLLRGVAGTLGGALMLLLVRLQGGRLVVVRALWGQLAWLTAFNMIGWNVLSTYGVMYLPSGRAALLAYTMPLWCVPLSVWLLRERLNARRVLAVALGVAGVAVLMGPAAAALGNAPLGVLLMVLAALSWAWGIVLLKLWSPPLPALVLTGWTLLLGALPMLAASLVVDGLPTAWPGPGAMAAVAFNALVTFMLCYWAWNRLVMLVPVAVSSLSSLVTPLIGVLSGAVFLGEQPGWAEATAALLILGAVGVINLRRR